MIGVIAGVVDIEGLRTCAVVIPKAKQGMPGDLDNYGATGIYLACVVLKREAICSPIVPVDMLVGSIIVACSKSFSAFSARPRETNVLPRRI